MAGLVSELQVGALDSSKSVSDLLRMAKVVAVKLDLRELSSWIDSELGGYEELEIPSYRIIGGQLKVFNPYRGLIPVVFPNDDLAKSCNVRAVGQKISELEILANASEGKLHFQLSDEQQLLLQRLFKTDFEFKLIFAHTALSGIVDSVRNAILNWSLKLEQNGIIGDGMTFSQEDKAKAHSTAVTYQINRIDNFTGNMGAVSDHSSVNVSTHRGLDTTGLTQLVAQLREYDGTFGLPLDKRHEMNARLTEMSAALAEATPIPSRIGVLLGALKSIMQGAASSLLVHGAIAEIDKYKHLIPSL